MHKFRRTKKAPFYRPTRKQIACCSRIVSIKRYEKGIHFFSMQLCFFWRSFRVSTMSFVTLFKALSYLPMHLTCTSCKKSYPGTFWNMKQTDLHPDTYISKINKQKHILQSIWDFCLPKVGVYQDLQATWRCFCFQKLFGSATMCKLVRLIVCQVWKNLLLSTH